MDPVIVWLREDLRVRDNPAITEAAGSGHPLLFLYLYTPQEEKPWEPGEGSRFWLHYSLSDLEKEIQKMGGQLLFYKGTKALPLLTQVIKKSNAFSVYFNISYKPSIIERDRKIYKEMKKNGVQLFAFHGNLLVDPKEIVEVHKKPYTVFTPFYTCLKKCGVEKPSPLPKKPHFFDKKISSDSLADLQILPKTKWIKDLEEFWVVGTSKVSGKLKNFAKKISKYKKEREYPAIDGTSKLSPSLHWGEIGSRELWHAFSESEEFQREIAWRDFAKNLLLYFPKTTNEPLKEEFSKFPWKKNSTVLTRWKEGKTGYPFVDAGMRQLRSIGWMHNRVRMVVASFLVKDLHMHWLEGAKWFWEKLVDADLANNTLGWQWSAGCGADAAPFFRIFNPVTQGKKFDPEGEYVRRYIPELEKLPNKYIHEPWKADEKVLESAGVTLGKNYPYPMVDHNEMRKKSLDIFHRLIKKS